MEGEKGHFTYEFVKSGARAPCVPIPISMLYIKTSIKRNFSFFSMGLSNFRPGVFPKKVFRSLRSHAQTFTDATKQNNFALY